MTRMGVVLKINNRVVPWKSPYRLVCWTGVPAAAVGLIRGGGVPADTPRSRLRWRCLRGCVRGRGRGLIHGLVRSGVPVALSTTATPPWPPHGLVRGDTPTHSHSSPLAPIPVAIHLHKGRPRGVRHPVILSWCPLMSHTTTTPSLLHPQHVTVTHPMVLALVVWETEVPCTPARQPTG